MTVRKSAIGKKSDLIFYCALLVWPVLQFLIFYVYVNFNSFFLAFKDIELVPGKGYVSKPSVQAFKDLFTLLQTKEIREAALTSILVYGLTLVVVTPLGLLFSYYISKKLFASGFFRVMLFLPSILSSVVMVTIYTYFVNNALPNMLEDFFGMKDVMPFLSRPKKIKFVMVFIYNFIVGFGVSVLMYANAMSAISPEVMEAAKLDGATGIKEFLHVSLPMIFPTLSVFLVTGIASIFTNQYNLYSFFSNQTDPPFQTFGYYMYVNTMKVQAKMDMSGYPQLSALGLAMTFVAVPLTYLVKWLLEKFGPSED